MRRREFLIAAAAGLSQGKRLRIGVGTFSYHNETLDEMIAQLRLNRIDEIEMSRGEFMLMKPPSDQMCALARRKFDGAGIRCVSYYSATIKNDDDVERAVRIAKLLGAVNVSGDATGDVLHAIDERFTKEGLTFGIHNHFLPKDFRMKGRRMYCARWNTVRQRWAPHSIRDKWLLAGMTRLKHCGCWKTV